MRLQELDIAPEIFSAGKPDLQKVDINCKPIKAASTFQLREIIVKSRELYCGLTFKAYPAI